MEKYYYFDYLKNNTSIPSSIIHAMKFELDQQIYYYGKQYKESLEDKSYSLDVRIKTYIKIFASYIRSLSIKTNNSNNVNIICNAAFNLGEEIKQLGINVFSPPWSSWNDKNRINEYRVWKFCNDISNSFTYDNYCDILISKNITRLIELQSAVIEYYSKYKIRSVILHNDLSYFENMTIQIFNKFKLPSFVFLHGLPARYNGIDDNRAKYLIVWGEKIKSNYINSGVEENKIIVTGHPYYKYIEKKSIIFDLENIMVITKSMPWVNLNSNESIICDRGNCILYLFMIESVLRKKGVKKVRLRLHPSENEKWYRKYIGNEFYVIDNEDLASSISKSTLVIGPTSTVFIESIYHGINYVVFEPAQDGIDLINYKLVNPFDSSDNRIPVAKNEEELLDILNRKLKVDRGIINDYIKTPFNIDILKEMIL